MMSDLGAMLTASKVAGPSLQRAPVCEGHDESAHVVQLVAIVHLVVLAVREANGDLHHVRGVPVPVDLTVRFARVGRGRRERAVACCRPAALCVRGSVLRQARGRRELTYPR